MQNFCVAPWIHFVLDGEEVLPCCRMIATFSPIKIGEEKIFTVLNSVPFQEIRSAMLEDKEVSFCTECLSNEKAGIFSERLKYNKVFEKELKTVQEKGHIEIRPEDIKHLELRPSNFCNLACRTCGPEYSTAWNDEAMKLGHIKKPLIKRSNLSRLPVLENCKEISFAGGEPLLDPDHVRFLEDLVQARSAPHMTLVYNTNLSLSGQRLETFIALWKHFKSVRIMASIDHVEKDKAEYIRHNSVWEDVSQNLLKIAREKGPIQLGAQVTVSLFNILDVDIILDHLLKTVQISPHLIYLNPVHTPEYYSVALLPTKLKARVREWVAPKLKRSIFSHGLGDAHIRLYSEATALMDFMDKHRCLGDLDAFLKQVRTLDSMRNEDFFQTFPKIAALLRE